MDAKLDNKCYVDSIRNQVYRMIGKGHRISKSWIKSIYKGKVKYYGCDKEYRYVSKQNRLYGGVRGCKQK